MDLPSSPSYVAFAKPSFAVPSTHTPAAVSHHTHSVPHSVGDGQSRRGNLTVRVNSSGNPLNVASNSAVSSSSPIWREMWFILHGDKLYAYKSSSSSSWSAYLSLVDAAILAHNASNRLARFHALLPSLLPAFNAGAATKSSAMSSMATTSIAFQLNHAAQCETSHFQSYYGASIAMGDILEFELCNSAASEVWSIRARSTADLLLWIRALYLQICAASSPRTIALLNPIDVHSITQALQSKKSPPSLIRRGSLMNMSLVAASSYNSAGQPPASPPLSSTPLPVTLHCPASLFQWFHLQQTTASIQRIRMQTVRQHSLVSIPSLLRHGPLCLSLYEFAVRPFFWTLFTLPSPFPLSETPSL